MSDHFTGPIVQATDLTKQVLSEGKPLVILHEVNFQIMRGESVAILGASGSGKSTLLGLLAGLDTASAGSVSINGIDLFSLDEDGRAALRGKMLGFVFQSFQLLPALTALENVMLPLELFGKKNARRMALDILERVGLAQRVGHYPKQLSGGEQQRVAIARAFVTQPALMLADEPTGNLDTETGAHIIDLLFELNREHGTTLLLVTHDESLAERCSRRIKLSAGRLMTEDHHPVLESSHAV